MNKLGFPGGLSGKESTCQCWRRGFNHYVRKIPKRRKHSGILAWKIPWTEEPGWLQSMGPQESDTTERRSCMFPVMGLQNVTARSHLEIIGPTPCLLWQVTSDLRSRGFLLNDVFQWNCPHFLRAWIGQGPQLAALETTEMNGRGRHPHTQPPRRLPGGAWRAVGHTRPP